MMMITHYRVKISSQRQTDLDSKISPSITSYVTLSKYLISPCMSCLKSNTYGFIQSSINYMKVPGLNVNFSHYL